MTRTRLALSALVAAWLAGCAQAPVEPSSGPVVKSSLAGMLRLPKEERRRGVYVDVPDDAPMRAALEAHLAALGIQVVATPSSETWRLAFAPAYYGGAGARPAVGSAEREAKPSALPDLLPGLWNSIAYTLEPRGDVIVLDVFGRATGVKAALDRPFGGSATRDPRTALVTRVALTLDGRTQRAEILTESFADAVPLEAMVADNVRLLIWLLE